MASWGTGPIDNNTAVEWLSESLSETHRYVDQALSGDEPDEYRAAAFLLERIGFATIYPADNPHQDLRGLETHLRMAVDRLDELVENKEWLGLWDDPAAVQQAISEQLAILRDRRENMVAPRSTPLMERIDEAIEENKTPGRGSSQDAVRSLKRSLLE